jgi:hypothetical protein
LIAGLRDGEVWIVASPADESTTEGRVFSYGIGSDTWTERGRDRYGVVQGRAVLAVAPYGDAFVLGHTPREVPPSVVKRFERIAWPVSPDTLLAVSSAPPPETSVFVYPRGAVRGPDGRLFLLEAPGEQIQTPVRVVTFDPVTGEWVELPATPTPRIRPLLAVDPVGGVYLIGGQAPTQPSSVIRLDPVTREWSTAPELRLNSSEWAGGNRFGSAAAFGADGRLYVFIGLDSIYRLDPVAGVWTQTDEPAMPVEPHDAVLAADGSIVVVGHEGSSQGQPAVWIFTPGQ